MRYARMLIILLVLVFCLQGCARSQPVPKPQETDILAHLLDDFSKAIENGVPSDMRLTLYWEPPYLEQLAPYTRKEDFIRGRSRTLLNSTQLASQINELKKIDSVVLQPPEGSQYKDINICYWIETDAARTVLEVEISREGGTITINGVDVNYDPAFFDLVSPYMDTWKYDHADWSID